MPLKNSQYGDNQYIIVVLTFLDLLPLVYFIPPWVEQTFGVSHFFTTLISVGIIVSLISYVWLQQKLDSHKIIEVYDCPFQISPIHISFLMKNHFNG